MNKKCEWCEIVGTAPWISGYVNHHINMEYDEFGNKIGKTVRICRYHHGKIHGYINEMALKEIRKIRPNFVEEITEQFLSKKDLTNCS